MNEQDDFYEDDEPIEEILAILERAPDGVTTAPYGVPVTTASPRVEGNRLVRRPAERAS